LDEFVTSLAALLFAGIICILLSNRINELLYSVGDGGGDGRSSSAVGSSPPAGDGMLVFN